MSFTTAARPSYHLVNAANRLVAALTGRPQTSCLVSLTRHTQSSSRVLTVLTSLPQSISSSVSSFCVRRFEKTLTQNESEREREREREPSLVVEVSRLGRQFPAREEGKVETGHVLSPEGCLPSLV